MERICLNQNALEIQLAEELFEHRPLVVLAGGYAQSDGAERHLGNVDAVGRRPYAEPAPAVGWVEPLRVLPSHIS